MARGIKAVTDEAIKKYLETYYITGYKENEETFARYRREANIRFKEWVEFNETTMNLRNKYTPLELKQLAVADRKEPLKTKYYKMEGNIFRFAHITDTHMGSIFFNENIWNAIVHEINNSNVDCVFHTGDITEGFNSKRVDGIYEMAHIGYAEQKKYASEMLSQIDAQIYCIDGNHDRWYQKPMGANMVEDIAMITDNVKYLGSDMADFVIENNDRPIKIRLWHGEDGSSYATSYRVQKIIESFTGGDKPNVLLCGHTHKQICMFDRNIHCVSGGAVCTQSNWMRGKRLSNHTGFHIVEMEFNERGITKFTPTWYPFYE